MLNVCESNAGRFAASLSPLKDINGDGLSDVAVGAPLEDDGTGVVYIYLGDKTYGINTETSPQVTVRLNICCVVTPCCNETVRMLKVEWKVFTKNETFVCLFSGSQGEAFCPACSSLEYLLWVRWT